ncbi:MAG TPA: PfkB family carbohydrate kinase [Gemmatimonadales bacterium]|nr:PfkB family carbohydrate kinase [Gemmatimonadales bacterium]
MPKIGVLGALVWDVIHGRDPSQGTVEEWGGIAYSLAAMDAALPDGWEIVPLIKVGHDRSRQAAEFARTLEHFPAHARFIEVPVANNQVELRYQSAERRCERMAGGVPGWKWDELGPMVQDLDFLYVNFISGFEMCAWTAANLRQGFRKPIYADLHSLFLGMRSDGIRTLQPLQNIGHWFSCFDYVQLNEDEMRTLGDEPMALSAEMLRAGVTLLNVTLGAKGVAYVHAPKGGTVRTALLPPPAVDAIDTTGCGDTFGATCAARLAAGDSIEEALAVANRFAARNATIRGATHLAGYLRGGLVTA